MLIATLMAAATIAAPPVPPAPPAPPAGPPTIAAPPPPPSPLLPPEPPEIALGPDGPQMIQVGPEGGRTTIITRRAHGEGAPHGGTVLTYRAPDGRDVTVISDRALTQADAERLRHDTPARPVMDLEQLASIRDQVREAGRQARDEAAHARDYAALVRKQVRIQRTPDGRETVIEGDWPDADFGKGFGPGPERAQMEALRAQMAELRAQMRQMKRELDSAFRDRR